MKDWEKEYNNMTPAQKRVYDIVKNALRAIHKGHCIEKYNNPESHHYTVDEVCRALPLKKGTVLNLISSGEFEAIKFGSEAANSPYRITFDSIIRHMLRINLR